MVISLSIEMDCREGKVNRGKGAVESNQSEGLFMKAWNCSLILKSVIFALAKAEFLHFDLLAFQCADGGQKYLYQKWCGMSVFALSEWCFPEIFVYRCCFS